MRRRKKRDESALIPWVFILGVPLFLLMEHPVIFWCVFVPLVVLAVIGFIRWVKK